MVVSIIIIVAMAMLFAIFGGFSTGYTVKGLAWWALAGGTLGAIALPEFEPKSFRYPILWQMFFAVVGAVLVAFAFDAPKEGYALAVVVGLVMGYLAPYWIKHIQLP